MGLIHKNKFENSQMKVDDLTCVLHQPPGLKQKYDANGKEIAQSLPPSCPTSAFVVDEYPACPANWMHGSARASSYFVPVEIGRGMWFDFNANADKQYDIAAMVSIQGVNAITGQKTSTMRLEQYKERCPVHDREFGHNRHCEECGYQWPAQNYISTTGQPRGQFWIDGFRNADGIVRQYLVTEEECRGVAAQTIGEDRVFAIGIAFFRSKNPKPRDPDIATFKRISIPLHKQQSGGVAGGQWMNSGEEKTAGGVLKGFKPSNTISPSVSLNDGGDLESYSSTLDFDGGSAGPIKHTMVPPIPSQIKCCMPPPSSVESTELNAIVPNPETLGLKGAVAKPKTRGSGSSAGAASAGQFAAPSSQEDYWMPVKPAGFPQDDATSLQQLSAGDANLDIFYSDNPSEGIPSIAPGAAPFPEVADVGVELEVDAEVEIDAEIEGDTDVEIVTKKLEIGAGAKINQKLYADPKSLDYWDETPMLVYINYVDVETCKKILAAGKKDLTKGGEGFLAGLEKGNK